MNVIIVTLLLLLVCTTANAADTVKSLLEKAVFSDKGQIEYALQALQLDPENPEVHRILAAIYYESGKLDQSLASYNKLIKLKPEFSDAYLGRAMVLMKLGDAKAAEKDVVMSKEIKAYKIKTTTSNKVNKTLNSKELKSLQNEIFELVNSGNYQEAIQLYEQYISIVERPKNQTVLYSIIRAYKETNDLTKAVDVFAKLIELFPSEADIYIQRGKLKEEIGDISGAAIDRSIAESIEYEKIGKQLENYNKIISQQPTDKQAYIDKAEILIQIGELENAFESINKAISLNPNKADESLMWYKKRIEKLMNNKR